MTTGVLHSKVRGVTHANADGMSRQKIIRQWVRPGQKLIVKPEPDNPHGDGHAIGLWVKARALLIFGAKFQVGYISDDLSAELTRHLDAGGQIEVTVTDVTGGDERNLGVNIRIVKK